MHKNKVFLTIAYTVLLFVRISAQNDQPHDQSSPFDESSIPVDFAEAPAEEGAASSATGGSLVSVSLYLRVFFILGLLIILIYFTLKFLRRLSLQKSSPNFGSGIRVLSSQIVYGDRMLHVVEVAGECYLLGSSASSVQLIDHYKDKDVKDRILLETTQESPQAGSGKFVDLIRKRITGVRNVDVHSRSERLRTAVETLEEDSL